MKHALTFSSLLLALLLSACGDATPPSTATAPAQTDSIPAANPPAPGWSRYQNSQFGYQIDYPSELAAQPETPEGRSFASADQSTQLAISAKTVAQPVIADLAKARRAELEKEGLSVGEAHEGNSWFMTTGKLGEQQLFEQSFLRDGALTTVRLSYPVAQAAVWQPRIGDILKTIIPGSSKPAQ
ncbi:hypothetical protein [Chitinilyticum litopenaei]|uniref:hypothetical protein n=1 Tax=Chitinilyticum litopenaei TaxID=1121276 RepID=UPI000405B398|nr:hypothetical protein [Chitinilyticum litopenaei]